MTIEQMPRILSYLVHKVEAIEISINKLMGPKVQTPQDEWMNIKDLRDYLPTHPARQTIYEWVKNRTIPFHKTSKLLTFNKKEIDSWLQGGYHKTAEEIERDADEFLNSMGGAKDDVVF